jgi:hypothetical protein
MSKEMFGAYGFMQWIYMLSTYSHNEKQIVYFLPESVVCGCPGLHALALSATLLKASIILNLQYIAPRLHPIL